MINATLSPQFSQKPAFKGKIEHKLEYAGQTKELTRKTSPQEDQATITKLTELLNDSYTEIRVTKLATKEKESLESHLSSFMVGDQFEVNVLKYGNNAALTIKTSSSNDYTGVKHEEDYAFTSSEAGKELFNTLCEAIQNRFQATMTKAVESVKQRFEKEDTVDNLNESLELTALPPKTRSSSPFSAR